jgi:hypothetical protein
VSAVFVGNVQVGRPIREVPLFDLHFDGLVSPF